MSPGQHHNDQNPGDSSDIGQYNGSLPNRLDDRRSLSNANIRGRPNWLVFGPNSEYLRRSRPGDPLTLHRYMTDPSSHSDGWRFRSGSLNSIVVMPISSEEEDEERWKEGRHDKNEIDRFLAVLENGQDSNHLALADQEQALEAEDAQKEALKQKNKVKKEHLLTDPYQGLSSAEAASRQRLYGRNRLSEAEEHHLRKFFSYFIGPIQTVMEIAAILAAGLQLWVDFGVLIGLLLLNACVGFLQEFQAGSIVQQLKKSMALKTHVIRNGATVEIEAIDMVPGDIVPLEEGSIIPADGLLLDRSTERSTKLENDDLQKKETSSIPYPMMKTVEVDAAGSSKISTDSETEEGSSNSSFPSLQVDQSFLTGESLPVDKIPSQELYSSSIVRRGEGWMIVTSIGDGTFLGKTAALVNDNDNSNSHFSQVISRMGITLLFILAIFIFAILIADIFRGLSIVVFLQGAFVLMVVGVPVGLPAVVTTTLAVGAAQLARKGVIVRRLSAIESLAGVDVLCTDKTGTLTQNKLTLHDPFIVPPADITEVLTAAVLSCSWKLKGLEPLDKTILLTALRAYQDVKERVSVHDILFFQPFDPVTKRAYAVVRRKKDEPGKREVCAKGAPQVILELAVSGAAFPHEDIACDDVQSSRSGSRAGSKSGSSASINNNMENSVPTEEEVLGYQNAVDAFSSVGYRTLGVMKREIWCSSDGVRRTRNRLIGVLPFHDPPRKETARTLHEAQELGLEVKMLTGDAVGIAKETARQLQLGTNIYDATLLMENDGEDEEERPDRDAQKSPATAKKPANQITLTGSELYDFVEGAHGFAQVYPHHKYRVVDILQRRGHLVAMTGDGVNDAPSLHLADTGIAVEGASSAAQTAADLVFISVSRKGGGLLRIIDALKTARRIFQRMRAYILYRIALSLHLELFFSTTIIILATPVVSLELIAFIAIFADIATLAIAYDHATFSKLPTKWDLTRLWTIASILGFFLAISSWILLGTLIPNPTSGGIIQSFGNASSILFLQIVLTQNWLIFLTRLSFPLSQDSSKAYHLLPSPFLFLAIFAVDILATLFCLFGWFSSSSTDIVTVILVWLYSFACILVLFIIYYGLSISKFISRMSGTTKKKTAVANIHPDNTEPYPEDRLENLLIRLENLSTQHAKRDYERQHSILSSVHYDKSTVKPNGPSHSFPSTPQSGKSLVLAAGVPNDSSNHQPSSSSNAVKSESSTL